jgi:uncharacterized protein (DUF1330 family)
MKTRSLIPAIFMMAVGSLLADTKPALVVQVVQTDDSDAYVEAITKVNALVKTRTGIEKLRHVWMGDLAGDNSHGIFVVSEFPSAAAIYATQDKLKEYPEMDALLARLKGMRHLGSSYLYKAVRYEGGYEGGAVFNTSIKCTDEAAYLKALDGLKAILVANGFKDAKVNLWRIVSGRTESTHLVVIALPSQARVGELWDSLTDKDLLADWYVGAAKLRTTLHNGAYKEITK